MDFVFWAFKIADLNSYQREPGAFKFHALAEMFAALHGMSAVELVCLKHFAPVRFKPICGVRLGLISYFHFFPCYFSGVVSFE